jgi:hypothetical protein
MGNKFKLNKQGLLGHIPRGREMYWMGFGRRNIRGRGALLAIGPPNEEKGGKTKEEVTP